MNTHHNTKLSALLAAGLAEVTAPALAQKAMALQNTMKGDDIWVKAAPVC